MYTPGWIKTAVEALFSPRAEQAGSRRLAQKTVAKHESKHHGSKKGYGKGNKGRPCKGPFDPNRALQPEQMRALAAARANALG